MRPRATDGVTASVCLLVMFMSHAKMGEPIEMPFGSWLVWANKTCITWAQDLAMGRGNFGVVRLIEKHWIGSWLWCMLHRDHSVINNGTTYNAAFHQHSLGDYLL